ncbi:MAG: XRE family transcriptional regulator [Clostridia bacterium]|nr:XRE family transcriptional regulator [Clostridia bacterium]
MENINKFFAQNLKNLRKKKKLTQKGLAIELNYSEKTIAKWESGTTIPSVEAILKTATALDTDISTLLATPEKIYLLGIDAGGTKTCYHLCNEDGTLIEELLDTGCNSFDIGIENSHEILKSGIRRICNSIPYSSVVVYAGIAGGGSVAAVKEKHRKMLSEFGFAAFDTGSDNENIISAGLDGRDGITIILGTGICLFKVKGNEHTQISGRGYLFDDAGSAFNFGQDAIKAYYAQYDGFGKHTQLFEMIENKAQCGGSELLSKLYSGGKKYIASFAPLVFECAQKYNDEVSINIIKRNFNFVAKLIKSAADDFDMPKIPVVIAGGLTNQPQLCNYLYAALNNDKRINLEILDKQPVDGAIKKAQDMLKNIKENK